jgi:hypothetical protein
MRVAFAGRRGRDDVGGMEVGGRRDIYRIDIGECKQLIDRGDGARIEAPRRGLAHLVDRVAHRDDAHSGVLRDRRHQCSSGRTHADDAESNLHARVDFSPASRIHRRC